MFSVCCTTTIVALELPPLSPLPPLVYVAQSAGALHPAVTECLRQPVLATGRQMASGEGDSCPVRYQCVTSALLSALLSALPSALPLSIMGVLKTKALRNERDL